MKKILISLTALLMAAAVTLPAYAKTDPSDLKFSPQGSGTFIYCNNNESIPRNRLSDISNPDAEYLMTNQNMKSGKYSLYASHLNHTELKTADGQISEAGFDIEVDVRFLAEEDTVIKLSSAAFETPELNIFYENGMLKKTEGDWGCIQAVADYMQRPICQLNGDTQYFPLDFKEVNITLKQGEEVWLSKYIENYRSIPWLKPVQILADFEIVSGSAEIDVAALRANGTVGDRSHNSPDAKFGAYHRDREHKGLADSLPFVYSDKMEYVIDDTVLSGTLLPVTLYNQIVPNGNTVDHWFTHLNPQTDAWSSAVCTESEMLPIYYNDPSKLDYYGENIKDEDKDEVWHFDTTHADTAEYIDGMEVKSADYVPNYRIPDGTVNYDTFGCHLGNYGVGVNYVVSIKNNSSRERYFNYNLRTTANNIVNVRDEKGEYVGDYSLLKGRSDEKREDTMACIKLLPNTETSFMIEVLLPMNYPGGMENSFVITDTPADMTVLDDERLYKLTPDKFTGKEYFKWSGENIYTSYDKENWTKHTLSDTTKEIFKGNWNNYDIISTDRGYMAKCSEYQTSPSYYTNILNYYYTVYFLDKDFNVTGLHKFDEYPNEISFARDKYYVKTDNYIYYSEDTDRWKTLGSNDYDMPLDNGGIFSVAAKDSEYYVSTDGVEYIKTAYPPSKGADENTSLYYDEKEQKEISGIAQNITDKPLYIDIAGDYYFYADGTKLYLSKTALKWHCIDFNEKITSVEETDGEIYINGRYRLLYDEEVKNTSFMRVDDDIMSLDGIIAIINDRTVIPVRLLSEYFGAKVIWNPNRRTVNIYYNGDTIVYTIDSNQVKVNANVIEMDTKAVIVNDTTMIPIRAFAECMSLDFAYDEDKKIISIKTPEKVFEGIISYPDSSLPDKDAAVPDNEAAKKLAQTYFKISFGENFLDGFSEFDVFYNEVTGCYELSAHSERNEGIFIEAVIEKATGRLVSMK